ncbi:MAG TPA: hypothetical protein VEL76_34980, partial [Gemmataceae bacterium]|nr:hypothetical protein [Gemmataceae bacterium]
MSKIVYWSKGLSSLLLLAAFGLQARGEYVPPATLDELLKADCVAVGRFTKKDGTLRFLPGRILRGEANIVEEAIKRGRLPISTDTKGRLLAHQWGRDLGGEQQDASASALWFFSSKWRSAVQPLELTEGFEALLGGKRPNATFRLLQHLDFDLRREALEELFAKPDKKLVAELHAIAERTDSQLVARAIEVLIQTRLLDVDRFWSKWLDHPARYRLQPVLQARDADRVTTAMLKAIATEKQPARLAQLLYDLPKDRPAYVEANLRHLGHAEETVRQQVVWNLYNLFWSLASQSRTSAKARDDITALARRALPLLEARLKEEKAAPIQRTLAQLVAKQDGVAWVFRVPTTYEPLPPYSDIEEMKVLIARLTSSTDR